MRDVKCRHENARDLRCVSVDVPYLCRRCVTCGYYLSLGPANDTPEVLVEIRAAEIAADLADNKCHATFLERCGFNETNPPLRGGGTVALDTTGTRAGYLARCIATHKDDQP